MLQRTLAQIQPTIVISSSRIATKSTRPSPSMAGRRLRARRIGSPIDGRRPRRSCAIAYRIVALKILRERLATDPEFQARFQREARIAAGLTHPNIDPGRRAAERR